MSHLHEIRESGSLGSEFPPRRSHAFHLLGQSEPQHCVCDSEWLDGRTIAICACGYPIEVFSADPDVIRRALCPVLDARERHAAARLAQAEAERSEWHGLIRNGDALLALVRPVLEGKR
jgi:hypothetical protein